MHITGIVLSACTLGATMAHAAEGDRPKFLDLVDQGFQPKASGKVVMKRRLIPQMDMGIFAHPSTGMRSCIGGLVLTIDGPVDSCDIRDVFADKVRYYRLFKGHDEFVCILDGRDECHSVR